ncbi:uncharacterized protein LOC126803461 [Argentina anserina]|uniref:uncharacterized protein LOC126803461 n=1 Tax=Argentina anserina TaxID=57926 RepID=UPI00217652A6|nr:uncharacterized protein LOC126803461 [Potentilla anserina]
MDSLAARVYLEINDKKRSDNVADHLSHLVRDAKPFSIQESFPNELLFRVELVYGKACHILVEPEHRAWWAVNNFNMDIDEAGEHTKLQLHEMEIRNEAYDSAMIYKEKTKEFNDRMIRKKHFVIGHTALLFNSQLRLFPCKLHSRWLRPFVVTNIFPYGAIQINGTKFQFNRHRLKPYYENFAEHNMEETSLLERTVSK